MKPKDEVNLLILEQDFKETFYANQDDCAITRACKRAKLNAHHTGGDCVVGMDGVYQLPKGVVELVRAIYNGLGRLHNIHNDFYRQIGLPKPIFAIKPVDIQCIAVRSKVMEEMFVAQVFLERGQNVNRRSWYNGLVEYGRNRSNEPQPDSIQNIRRIPSLDVGEQFHMPTPEELKEMREELKEMREELATRCIRDMQRVWGAIPTPSPSLVEYALAE